MVDCLYYANVVNDEFVYTKLVKGLFKTKEKVASKKEVFSAFDVKGFRLTPNLANIGLIEFLFDKYSYSLENKISDFGVRVKFEISNFEISELESRTIKECGKDVTYNSGIVNYDAEIKSDTGVVIISIEGVCSEFREETYIPTKELYEIAFSNAISGCYCTARDSDALFEALVKIEGFELEDAFWICEECKEKFNNCGEFFNHIIETHHKDTFVTQYAFDDEVKNVARLAYGEKDK